jgi:hypothetical protein
MYNTYVSEVPTASVFRVDEGNRSLQKMYVYQTTRRHFLEDRYLDIYPHEKFKCEMVSIYSVQEFAYEYKQTAPTLR